MSTKTTFKRVALVAVASLGFGMLSVAPSNAAVFTYTATPGTITPADGSAVVGSTVTIPLVLDTAAVNDTATTVGTFTASFLRVPNNSARVAANLLAGSVTRTGTTGATNLTNAASATTTQAVPSANTIVLTAGITNAPRLISAPAGEYTFVPDVPGVYQVNIAFTAGAGTPVGVVTDVTAITIIVGGAQLTQATGGKGSATGTATNAGSAVFAYTMPGATAAAARFNVTSTGVGSISNPVGCETDSTVLTNASTAVRCTGGGGVASTFGFGNGVNTADGLFFNNTTLSAGNVLIGPSQQTQFTVDAASAVAGVQTITVTEVALATGVPTTRAIVTITWGANPTASTSLTTVFAGQSSTRPTALETIALRLPSTAGVAASSTGTSVVAIAVNVNSGEGTALNGVPVSASISGPGLLSITSGAGNAAAGTARSVALTGTAQAVTHQSIIGVSGDGTRGVATITISSGTTVLATKTVTFYGAVATLTATQGVSIMRSGRTATSAVATFTLGGVDPTVTAAAATTAAQAVATNITIVAKDVDGNVVPLTAGAVTADISDSAVIGAVNIAACLSATHIATSVCAAGDGYWLANTIAAVGGVSGAKATVTFKTPHPTLPATFISTEVPFSLGGSAAGGTVTMTLNKTAYEPGERVIVTYTAKDAAGNPVHDWASTGSPASNKAMVGLSGGIYVNGSHIFGDGATELTYAPTAPGPFIITLGTGTATGATITATATVGDDAATNAANAASDAAAEAIDAANAATDAANLAAEAADAATVAAEEARDAADAATAAVEALATEVATLMAALKAQITTLANTVAKIAKKVKA